MDQEIQKRARRLGEIYAENGYAPEDADEEIHQLSIQASPDNVTPEDFEEIKREIIAAFDEGLAGQ